MLEGIRCEVAPSERAAQPDFPGPRTRRSTCPKRWLSLNRPRVALTSLSGRSSARGRTVAAMWRGCRSSVSWTSSPRRRSSRRCATPSCVRPLVVLDLRELIFIDSSGVRVITNASARADRADRGLVLVRGPAQVDRMFTLITSDVPEIVDLDPGEPVAHALSQLARRAHAA